MYVYIYIYIHTTFYSTFHCTVPFDPKAAEENIVPTKAVWRLWNMDGDEKLSNAEFEYCMKKAFPDIKDKKLLQILQTMDEDLSGEVAEDEFVRFLLPPAKADPKDTISQEALGG